MWKGYVREGGGGEREVEKINCDEEGRKAGYMEGRREVHEKEEEIWKCYGKERRRRRGKEEGRKRDKYSRNKGEMKGSG